ncbi:MAG TPA: OmpW family outer membrane protein [Gemmatimonadales bacterium]|nr:OmpW family outer membrane protein [Gemmatimonadales bacterium]
MRTSLVGLLVAVLAIPAVAAAQDPAHLDHPWMVRARGVYIAPTGGTTTLGGLPLEVGADATAEIDISRRFGKYLGAELVLATAAHEVRLEDGASLGSVHILPPTLLLQFHLPLAGKVHPYIGAGVNYTMIYDKTGVLETPGLAIEGAEELDLGDSFGFAGQVGLDFDIGERAVFNVDFKYVDLKTELSVDGTSLGDVDVTPIIFGVGFGYRF